MSKNKIYIVIVYRWGDRGCHSYFVGAFASKQKAIDEAEKEEHYRGGIKYQSEIIETEINKSCAGNDFEFKTVKSLKNEQ